GDPEDLLRGLEILDHLAGRGLGDARDLAREPRSRLANVPQPDVDVPAQARHLLRQLRRATWRLPQPERDRRGLALGVHDAHLARLDPLDPIRSVAQLEDVAGHALDGEILVERSEEDVCRLEDNAVVADVPNRTARREIGKSGAAPRAQPAIPAIVV